MKLLWTAVYVKDLDESVAFYSDLVGLKLLRRFKAGPDVEIAFMGNGIDGETMIELLFDRSIKSFEFGDLISIGFAVESLDSIQNLLKSKGISIHQGPIEMPASKFLYIKDPNGLSVQFFQNK